MEMFYPLPTDFPRLMLATAAMDEVRAVAPPPLEEIGIRLRRIYEQARSTDYQSLSRSDWRKLPYALWVEGEPPLREVHGELIRRYWAEVLPKAVSSDPRRTTRWLAPLFFVYCEQFAEQDAGFREFAQRLVVAISVATGAYAQRLAQLQSDLAFFVPSLGPARLAEALLAEGEGLEEALASHLLWPRFVDSRLGEAAFDSALSTNEPRRRQARLVERLLEWADGLSTHVEKSRRRVQFAEQLLLPWRAQRPPDELKSVLVERFVRSYGDPRAAGAREYGWRDVSPEAVAVLMTWMAGDTLRGFMRILEQTADEIWRYRQRFWMAYYDAGYISEAWLALGRDAQMFARQLQPSEKGLGYGTLEGGAAPDQSVLILRIGNLVFTEWSHNGSLRAYPEDRSDTPVLYRRSYRGQDLREPQSMDFHDGANMNPELRHSSAHSGSWQRKARDFIRKHAGVHMTDGAIL